MRDTLVKELTKLAEKNKKIVILAGDIGYKLFDDFIKKFPKRFYNCGVAEANMTTVAAGLALKGFIPVTYTIATFNVYKTIEQIKIDICYPNLGVTVVGVGSGLSYSDLGSTHHAIEDIGLLRTIPNLSIYSPADPIELKAMIPKIIGSKKPCYLRIGKRGEENVYENNTNIKLNTWNKIISGKKVCLIVTGNIIINAKKAINNLKKRNIFPSLYSAHSIKPLDEKNLKKIFKKYNHIIIIEEHSSIGGLSGAISELALNLNLNNKFLSINTGNSFIVKSGKQLEAIKKIGLDAKNIERKIVKFLKI